MSFLLSQQQKRLIHPAKLNFSAMSMVESFFHSMGLRAVILSVFLILSMGCRNSLPMPSEANWQTTFLSQPTTQPMIQVGGRVDARMIGESLGMTAVSRTTAEFPMPVRVRPLDEILRTIRSRIQNGIIIDDYAVVELGLVRLGGSVGANLTDLTEFVGISGAYSSTICRMMVDAIEGATFRIGSDIAYYDTRETSERSIIGERKTVSTGVDVDVYWERADHRSGYVYGRFSVSSAADSQATNVARTEIPFRVYLSGGFAVPIVRLTVYSASLAADLTKLTGQTILAGDLVEFSLRLR